MTHTAAARTAAILLGAVTAACADVRPDTNILPRLDSGVTSSNGGGVRALGDQSNVGISTRAGPVR